MFNSEMPSQFLELFEVGISLLKGKSLVTITVWAQSMTTNVYILMITILQYIMSVWNNGILYRYLPLGIRFWNNVVDGRLLLDYLRWLQSSRWHSSHLVDSLKSYNNCRRLTILLKLRENQLQPQRLYSTLKYLQFLPERA